MKKLTENQSVTLESLRACSALIVALSHSYMMFIHDRIPGLYIIFAILAQCSVMVFFVLSGFLIGCSIQNNINRHNGSFNLSLYFTSRALRIYPPLIFSLSITAFISLLSIYVLPLKDGKPLSAWSIMPGYSLDFRAGQYLSTITFTNTFTGQHVSSNGALWSLPIEVWYYIVTGFFFMKKPVWKILSICLFLILQGVL